VIGCAGLAAANGLHSFYLHSREVQLKRTQHPTSRQSKLLSLCPRVCVSTLVTF
jgi:hypothetical protein